MEEESNKPVSNKEKDNDSLRRVTPEEMNWILERFKDDEAVYNSIRNYPSYVYTTAENCCQCDCNVIKIYFFDFPGPLRGMAGDMRICPQCRKRLSILRSIIA